MTKTVVLLDAAGWRSEAGWGVELGWVLEAITTSVVVVSVVDSCSSSCTEVDDSWMEPS